MPVRVVGSGTCPSGIAIVGVVGRSAAAVLAPFAGLGILRRVLLRAGAIVPGGGRFLGHRDVPVVRVVAMVASPSRSWTSLDSSGTSTRAGAVTP